MKRHYTLQARRSGGFSLVLVLGFMVILVAIVVAFLGRAATERKAASGFSSSVRARQLSDFAVATVQGQINMAVNQGTGFVWASQPGMIRSYRTAGNPDKTFKLYSAKKMLESKTALNLADDTPPATWAADTATWVDINSPVTRGSTTIYPIVDPRASSQFGGKVQGFSITNAPGATADQQAPMPLRWLYILQDGTMTPASGTGTTATFSGETASNPVVGRIAFWTDDDTCKININTACGDELGAPLGSYWDTPRYSAGVEQTNFSKFLPVQNEFQRFPGHPATVYLAKVFPDLKREQLTALAARYKTGGTLGGTQEGPAPIDLETRDGNDSGSDRLYTSVDELIFDPDRNATGILAREEVEHAQFFLTAHNRSPELNMFNLPRVSMWPLDGGDGPLGAGTGRDAWMTGFDKLIRLATTINGTCYGFRRTDAISPTVDAVPNMGLFNYLDALTSRQFPFFDCNLSTTYTGGAREQMLVQILDYIRITNLHDAALPAANRYTLSTTAGTGSTADMAGVGQVTPLRMTTPAGEKMGFGRFYTLSEAGLIFSNEAEYGKPQKPVDVAPSTDTAPPAVPTVAGQRVIEPAFLMEPFCVAAGFYIIGMNSTWTVEGLESLRVESVSGPVPLFSPGIRSQTVARQLGKLPYGKSWGAVGDIRAFRNFNGTDNYVKKTAPYNDYKFSGNRVTIAGSQVVMYGGTVTIRIYQGSTATGDPVQTIVLQIPGGTFPAPVFNQANRMLSTRLKNLGYPGDDYDSTRKAPWKWINPEDMVRSMVVKHGDIRLVANNRTPGSLFVKHGDWDSTSLKAHSFQTVDRFAFIGARFNKLAEIAGAYPSDVQWGSLSPKLPYVSTAPTPPYRDFDTGMGKMNDGAYINKADEGPPSIKNKIPDYYTDFMTEALDPAFFSPNRIVPSPVILGSLSAPQDDTPWRTLYFRPDPAKSPSDAPHPGWSGAHRDFLWLDLFWMPIVQPYAISEPFSTAGKVNLNHQIVPFTYIRRTTAIEAAVYGEQFLAIPNTASSTYKPETVAQGAKVNYRRPINVDHIVQQIDAQLITSATPFVSPAQITGFTLEPGFDWSKYRLTGDNARERPYASLYQKFTTRSNSYTVYFTVQALKKVPASALNEWNEGRDQVTAEYRGSTAIERYGDFTNANIPNYLTDTGSMNSKPLDQFYKWRVISNRQFAP